jgi:hypothetical protein
MLSLLGLKDTYVHDGRVLIDQLNAQAVAQTLVAHRETVRRLGEAYKQLNAPFGEFGMSALVASTKAVKSGSASDDSTYTSLENSLSALTDERNTLAVKIRAALDGAAFSNEALNEQQAKQYIDDAQSLIARAVALAAE